MMIDQNYKAPKRRTNSASNRSSGRIFAVAVNFAAIGRSGFVGVSNRAKKHRIGPRKEVSIRFCLYEAHRAVSANSCTKA